MQPVVYIEKNLKMLLIFNLRNNKSLFNNLHFFVIF